MIRENVHERSVHEAVAVACVHVQSSSHYYTVQSFACGRLRIVYIKTRQDHFRCLCSGRRSCSPPIIVVQFYFVVSLWNAHDDTIKSTRPHLHEAEAVWMVERREIFGNRWSRLIKPCVKGIHSNNKQELTNHNPPKSAVARWPFWLVFDCLTDYRTVAVFCIDEKHEWERAAQPSLHIATWGGVTVGLGFLIATETKSARLNYQFWRRYCTYCIYHGGECGFHDYEILAITLRS